MRSKEDARRWLARGLATAALVAMAIPAHAGTGTLSLSAVVLSKNSCKFNSGSVSLGVASLDAASTSPVTQSATITFKCGGSDPTATWSASADNGLYYSAGLAKRRMRNGTVTTEYLPYSLNLPASGTASKNVNTTLTITATIDPADFQNVAAGTYTDTVQLTLSP